MRHSSKPKLNRFLQRVLTRMGLLVFALLLIAFAIVSAPAKHMAAYLLAALALMSSVLLIPDTTLKSKLIPFAYKLFRLRYAIAAVAFVVLVGFSLHTASVEMWDRFFPEKSESYQSAHVAGEPRSVRSDEYLFITTAQLAQANADTPFPIVNMNYGENGQNMLIYGNIPAHHASIIARPALLGFLFLPVEQGFSFYWWFRLFALFFGAVELAMIVTRGKRGLSCAAGAVIALGAPMQWWLSSTLVDGFSFAMIAMALLYHLLTGRSTLKKALCAIGLALSAAGFAMSLYPPTLIPLGYGCLIFMAALIWRDRKAVTMNIYDWGVTAVGAGVLALLLLSFWQSAMGATEITLQTAYPGSRAFDPAQSNIASPFMYLLSPAATWQSITGTNPSEASRFLVLYPALLALFVYGVFKRKKQFFKENILSVALLCVMLLHVLLLLVPLGEGFYNSTLLSMTTPDRLYLTFGFFGVWLTVALLSGDRPFAAGRLWAFEAAVLCGALFVRLGYALGIVEQIGLPPLILLSLALATLCYLLIRREVGQFCLALSVFVLLTGGLVNPIASGLSPILDKQTVVAAKQVDEGREQHWLSLGDIYGQQLLVANGFKVFNAAQFAPDLAMWRNLDKQEKYWDIYNRFAHIEVELTAGETNFELVQPDVIRLNLNERDIAKTKVRFVLSRTPLVSKYFAQQYHSAGDNTYIYEYTGEIDSGENRGYNQ